MKTRVLILGLLFFKIAITDAQTNAIADCNSAGDFTIELCEEKVTGFYKVKVNSDSPSIFRRTVFRHDLTSESLEIEVIGNAQLLSNLNTASFHFYAFYSMKEGNESVIFILTDKNEKVLNSYIMAPQEFEGIFEGRVRKIKDLKLNLITPPDDEKTVIVYPVKDEGNVGRIFSMNIFSGKINWKLVEPLAVTQMVTVGERLIVLSEKKLLLEKYVENFIVFFDLKDGAMISAPYLGDKYLTRTIDLFTVVGKNLLVVGNEFATPITTTSLFTLAYDLDGNLLTKEVYSKPDKKGLRFKGLGTAYDQNGYLLVFGESFRKMKVQGMRSSPFNFFRPVLSFNLVGAANPALGISAVIPMPNQGHSETVTENLKILKINPSKMSIEDDYTFQSDRKVGFTEFRSLGPDVLIRVGEKIWFYNVNEPSVPPKYLMNLVESKDVILTSFGPISLENKSGTIVLEKILSD